MRSRVLAIAHLNSTRSRWRRFSPKVFEQDSQAFLDGSARIALQVRPRFTKYIFIERDTIRLVELEKLKSEFGELRDDIILVHADANSYLQDLCLHHRWTKNRAVLFLDPFGMQVRWNTIAAIAGTKAIDLWILFPLSAVNRLLKRDGQISLAWRNTLDEMFGSSDWYDAFTERANLRIFLAVNRLTP